LAASLKASADYYRLVFITRLSWHRDPFGRGMSAVFAEQQAKVVRPPIRTRITTNIATGMPMLLSWGPDLQELPQP